MTNKGNRYLERFVFGIIIVFTIYQWNATNVEVNKLVTNVSILNTNYNILKENNEQWIADYNDLKATNEKWITSYNDLKATNEQWISNYNDLKATNEQWISNYNTLKANNTSLTQIAEDNKFYFYYLKPKQKFGVNELASFVNGRTWNVPYQEGVFDCSEMSASMEQLLENEGFHTLIAIGDTPGTPGTKHAWLLVETTSGSFMPVEETTPVVVLWNYPNFNDYFKYDRTFESIQEALKYSPTEFDWWK